MRSSQVLGYARSLEKTAAYANDLRTDGTAGARPPAPLEQVDPRRHRHRERDAGVPVIALQDEDDGGDQARHAGAEPGQASQFHGRILALGADAVVVRNGV